MCADHIGGERDHTDDRIRRPARRRGDRASASSVISNGRVARSLACAVGTIHAGANHRARDCGHHQLALSPTRRIRTDNHEAPLWIVTTSFGARSPAGLPGFWADATESRNPHRSRSTDSIALPTTFPDFGTRAQPARPGDEIPFIEARTFRLGAENPAHSRPNHEDTKTRRRHEDARRRKATAETAECAGSASECVCVTGPRSGPTKQKCRHKRKGERIGPLRL